MVSALNEPYRGLKTQSYNIQFHFIAPIPELLQVFICRRTSCRMGINRNPVGSELHT